MFKKVLGILPLLCFGAIGLQAQCPIASAGQDDTICLNSIATLAATLPPDFTGTWTRVGNTPAATITTPTSANSTITGLTTAGNLRLVWTIQGPGECISRDTVSLIVSSIPTTGGFAGNVNAGTDRTLCVGGTISLAGTLPSGSIGSWSKAGGPNSGTIAIASPNSGQSSVTGFSLVSGASSRDTLVWTVTNVNCAVTVSDRVVIAVNAAPTIANGGSDRQKCQGDTIRLIGNTPVSGTPSWVLPIGANTAVFVPANSANNDTVVVQGNAGGTVNIAYRIANGTTTGQNAATIANGCLSVDTVALSFGPASANAGVDQNICQTNVSTVTLAASPLAAGGTGLWSFISKKGNEVITNPSSPTSTITGVTSDTLRLRWSVSAGSCTSTDEVTIRVTPAPTTANASVDRTVCATDTILFVGSTPVIGNPSWAFAGNTNSTNFLSNNPSYRNNDSVQVRILNAGTYSLVYTIASGNTGGGALACVSRDTVIITVNPAPTANAGPDQSICGSSSVILSGNRPASFTSGTWSMVESSAGTLTTINDTASSASGLVNGSYTFRWSVKNTFGCSATNNVVINFSTPPSAANAGPDRIGCVRDTLLLTGSVATSGSPSWALVGGSNGITFFPGNNSARNNDTVRVVLNTAGTYNLVYSVASGTSNTGSSCTSRDTLRITVNAAPLANAGSNQTLCNGAASVQVNGNRPEANATGKWTLAGNAAGTITAVNDTAASLSGLSAGSTILTWTITNAAGCTSSDNVTITIGAAPAIISAGADITQCANDTVVLSGTVVTAGQNASWAIAGGGGMFGPTFVPNGNNDTVRLAVRGSGSYNVVYTVSVGAAGTTCTSRDTLVLTVNPAPTATILTGTQLSCKNDSLYIIRASRPAVNTTGAWSFIGNTSAVLTPSDTFATVGNLPIGAVTVRWLVTGANGCDASATTTITRNAPPTVANAGLDINACTGASFWAVGNTPSSGTPSWSIVNSNLATLTGNTSNDSVSVRINGAGTIRLRYRISNGSTNVNTGCSSTDTLVITASPCTGIFDENDHQVSKLFVHPNPASTSLHVSFIDSRTALTELTILSLDGRAVYEEQLGSSKEIEKEINVSQLTKGMYIVRVKKGKEAEFSKLLIQ